MTTLSIILPDPLAEASQEGALKLGISRTQFIRQAIVNEIENFQAKLEEEAIIKSFSAMKNDKRYIKEVEKIEAGFKSDLSNEENEGEEWWSGKKS